MTFKQKLASGATIVGLCIAARQPQNHSWRALVAGPDSVTAWDVANVDRKGKRVRTIVAYVLREDKRVGAMSIVPAGVPAVWYNVVTDCDGRTLQTESARFTYSALWKAKQDINAHPYADFALSDKEKEIQAIEPDTNDFFVWDAICNNTKPDAGDMLGENLIDGARAIMNKIKAN